MSELDKPRAEAEALGVKVDGRWGADRLRAEVSAAQPAEDDEPAEPDDDEDDELDDDDDDDDDDELDDEPDDDENDELEDSLPDESEILELPEPFRAGGHINHGDGRGWILEPETE